MLSIKHLTKTYRGGKTAVSDLSLEVESGDIYGLSAITAPVKRQPSKPWLVLTILNPGKFALTAFPSRKIR